MSEYRTEKRVELDGITSVFIFNPIGRIEIEGWDNPDLLLETTIVSESEKMTPESIEPTIIREGERLQIRSVDPGRVKREFKDMATDFELEFEDFADGEVLSHIPDVVGKIVQFATDSAQKIQPGIQTALNIRLPAGIDVTVKNLNGVISVKNMTSRILVKAVNGPVMLRNITGQVNAKTVNGPLSLEKSAPEMVQLKSVNGPVKCYLDTVSGPVQLKSVNGPVRMTLPESADVNLTAKTMHGAVKISSAFKQTLRTSKKMCGTLKNGQFPTGIKTFSGPLTVVTSDMEPDSGTVQEPAASPLPLKKTESREPSDAPARMIERMLADGKITEAEADKLRRAL
ncbi:MAG TPA: DUF4097 family beta strand repeat-containing protein [bacterium]|nr:DUF4097 family beta strand repeat-containing protein [bacterium]